MRVFVAAVIVAALTAAREASSAPVLRSADVSVVMATKTCEVTMRLTVEGADRIDHRIDSTYVDLMEVNGTQSRGDERMVGRTRSLVLQPTDRTYQIHYTSSLLKDRDFRCPLWLPTIPTDGQSRAVAIHVTLPVGAVPAPDSMPALTWTDRRGEATLGHLPVFVYVPFTADGVSAPWSISRTMDVFTIAIIVFASGVWVWNRNRNRERGRRTSSKASG